jgi:hypothetical protein
MIFYLFVKRNVWTVFGQFDLAYPSLLPTKNHVFPREKRKKYAKIFHMKLDALREMFPNCDSSLMYLVPNAISSFVVSILTRAGC